MNSKTVKKNKYLKISKKKRKKNNKRPAKVEYNVPGH